MLSRISTVLLNFESCQRARKVMDDDDSKETGKRAEWRRNGVSTAQATR